MFCGYFPAYEAAISSVGAFCSVRTALFQTGVVCTLPHVCEPAYGTAGVLGVASTPGVFNELPPCFRIVDLDWGDP